MPNNRWDWLEGIRPQTPAEWCVSEMARLLLKELSSWPLDIAWTDSGAEGRYRELSAADASPPSHAALEHAIMRAGWDLAHDTAALEHYWRNHLLEEACPRATDRLASELVETFITEALFELIERTENRVKRRDALACLGQLSALLRSRQTAPARS